MRVGISTIQSRSNISANNAILGIYSVSQMNTLYSSWLRPHEDLILHGRHFDKVGCCSSWRRVGNQVAPRINNCFVVLQGFVVVEINAFDWIVEKGAVHSGFYHFNTSDFCANSRQEISAVLSQMPQNDDSFFTTRVQITLFHLHCTHFMDMPL